MKRLAQRLWCRAVGHHWRTVPPAGHASIMVTCDRCHEIAWRLL